MAFDLLLCGALGFFLYQAVLVLSLAVAGETNKLAVWANPWIWLLCIFVAIVIGLIVSFVAADATDSEIWARRGMEYTRAILLGYAGIPMLKKTSDAAVTGIGIDNTPVDLSEAADGVKEAQWWWRLQ